MVVVDNDKTYIYPQRVEKVDRNKLIYILQEIAKSVSKK